KGGFFSFLYDLFLDYLPIFISFNFLAFLFFGIHFLLNFLFLFIHGFLQVFNLLWRYLSSLWLLLLFFVFFDLIFIIFFYLSVFLFCRLFFLIRLSILRRLLIYLVCVSLYFRSYSLLLPYQSVLHFLSC